MGGKKKEKGRRKERGKVAERARRGPEEIEREKE